MRGRLAEIPQQAFLAGGCLLLPCCPPETMVKTWHDMQSSLRTDQLRKLSMNVEGIFLAGGKADVVPSNAIVLKLVVVSRARVKIRGEKRRRRERMRRLSLSRAFTSFTVGRASCVSSAPSPSHAHLALSTVPAGRQGNVITLTHGMSIADSH